MGKIILSNTGRQAQAEEVRGTSNFAFLLVSSVSSATSLACPPKFHFVTYGSLMSCLWVTEMLAESP